MRYGMKSCYFLVFRGSKNTPIDWEEPTGGLVMQFDVVDGHTRPDYDLAIDVIEQRYHCHSDETLRTVEVLDKEDRFTAHLLHKSWDIEMDSFLELMKV